MGTPEEWDRRSAVLLTILRSQSLVLKAMAAGAAKEDLTLQQFAMLRLISRSGPMSMRRLSEELRVSAPNITGVVDRLEMKGMVRRASIPGDRRTKEIQLTAKGKAAYARVRRGYSDSLEEALDELTVEEQEILSKLLKKLAREIVRKGEAGGPHRLKLTDG